MKQSIRSSPPKIGMAAILAAGLMFGATQSALALGTASGTPINNTASLIYTAGGFTQPTINSNTVTFVVDNKINLTVTGTGTSIVPNSTNQALYFTVNNIGNTSQSYTLAASINGAPTATMTLVGIYNDDSGTPGTYIAGTNTVYVPGAATVAAGGNLKVFIVASQTAPTATNGQTSTWNLLATTTNAGTAVATTVVANTQAGVEAVFAEGAAGTAAGDGVNDGKQSNTATYTVAITVPTVVKSATLLCDPFTAVLANAKNIPGSMTLWTIVVTNPSASPVILTSVADILDTTNLTIDPNLVVPTTAATCGSGTGVPAFAAGSGFKVVPSAARKLGGSAAGASAALSYFTTTSTADGVDFATPNVNATFSTILPIDAGSGHAAAGQLNTGESVTLYFNTTVN